MLLNGFFRPLKDFNNLIKKNFINIYRNSNFYDKKISKTLNTVFQYKPSPYLLSSLIKYQNKKYKIDELTRRHDRSHSTAGRLAEHAIDEI